MDRALELHGRALELAPTARGRARALEEIGDDHDAAYHGDEAVPAWDEALTIVRSIPGSDADTCRLATKAAYMGAVRWGGFATPMDPARIDAYVEEGRRAATDDDARTDLLALLAAAGDRWLAVGREDPLGIDVRIAASETAFDQAVSAGRYTTAGLALHMLGGLYLAAGDLERCIATQWRTIEINDRIESTRERHLYLVESFNTLIWIAGAAGDVMPRLAPWWDLGRDLSAHELLHSTYIVMSASYLTGDWDQLDRALDEHVSGFARETAMVCPFVRGGIGIGATVLARRGDPGRAEELLAMMPTVDQLGVADAWKAIAQGAIGDARAARGAAEAILAAGSRNFSEEPPLEIVAYVDALSALRDWPALAARLDELRARVGSLAIGPASLDRAEGMMAAAQGDRERAGVLLKRAVEAFDGLSLYDAARSREALASVDEASAGDLLASAIATYERLGAVADATRARVAADAAAVPSSTIGG